MSDSSIERVENLIRVVQNIPDDKFDIRRWYDPTLKCGCAIGHAIHDQYFISQGFRPNLPDAYDGIAEFFDIDVKRVYAIFVNAIGYGTRQDVLTALRVLLLEKRAQQLGEEFELAEAEQLANAYVELV